MSSLYLRSKKYKQAQHEKSLTQQYLMRALADPDFEDVPKPGKIREINGKDNSCCNTCRSCYLPQVWSRHFNRPKQFKPVVA